MLSRSARMVLGSREKAKELHSSLVLQPARKAQREAEIDIQEAIRILRAKGIGAHCASDPQGLDAIVAAAICSQNVSSHLPAVQPYCTSIRTSRKRRVAPSEIDAEVNQEGKQLWGYTNEDWHKCTLVRVRKSGKLKVAWKDGTTATLDVSYTQPRKSKSESKSARLQ
jgi:hypothetical protein